MISRFISVQETLQMLKCLCVIDIRVLGAEAGGGYIMLWTLWPLNDHVLDRPVKNPVLLWWVLPTPPLRLSHLFLLARWSFSLYQRHCLALWLVPWKKMVYFSLPNVILGHCRVFAWIHFCDFVTRNSIFRKPQMAQLCACLLYTSDAADER